MSDQEVDTTQTEPQDLSVKRPRIEVPEEDSEEADEQQISGTVEPPIDTNPDCDSTTNLTAEKSPISDEVVAHITDLYERKLFWDQVLDESNSTVVLESLKKSLTFKAIDIEEVVTNKNKRQVLVNCDTELKHLLTKLQFINELHEGVINKTKAQINSYQMKDFEKK